VSPGQLVRRELPALLDQQELLALQVRRERRAKLLLPELPFHRVRKALSDLLAQLDLRAYKER